MGLSWSVCLAKHKPGWLFSISLNVTAASPAVRRSPVGGTVVATPVQSPLKVKALATSHVMSSAYFLYFKTSSKERVDMPIFIFAGKGRGRKKGSEELSCCVWAGVWARDWGSHLCKKQERKASHEHDQAHRGHSDNRPSTTREPKTQTDLATRSPKSANFNSTEDDGHRQRGAFCIFITEPGIIWSDH